MTAKLKQRARRDDLLSAAVRLAAEHGYTRVTREQIAVACSCSPGTVSLYLGTVIQMRRAIMGAAIANEILPVIAQGLAVGDPRAKRVPLALRTAAADSII